MFSVSGYMRSGLYYVLPVFIWAVMVFASLAWDLANQNNVLRNMALEKGRNIFRFIELSRLWSAGHGGLYAIISEKAQPNPYLNVPNRDITTVTGLKLTLINPAYMTRQIGEISKGLSDTSFHITSLKPLRPENRADNQEEKYLKMFESGTAEAIELIGGIKDGTYRYMAPLRVKEPCMKCHAAQGYAVGDIRGGISVTYPASSIYTLMKPQRINALSIHVAVFVITAVALIVLLRKLHAQWFILKSAKDKTDAEVANRTSELKYINELLRNQIEQRKVVEEKLRLFELIVQNSPVTVVITSKDAEIEYVNPHFVHLTGYLPEEVLGKKPSIIKSEQTPPEVYEGMWEKIKNGDDWYGELLNKKKNGDLYWESVKIVPIKNDEGDIIHFLAVKEDITARRRLQNELCTLNESLKEEVSSEIEKNQKRERLLMHQSKLASMGEMIGAIAHQWRQPLSSIALLIQDIEDSYIYGELSRERIHEIVSKSMVQIKYMSATIDDFRNFFQPSKEKIKFNVIAVIDEVLSILHAQLKSHSVNTQIESKVADLPLSFGHPNEFKQVMLNLINNAKDAISEKRDKAKSTGKSLTGHGEIRIEVDTEDGNIVIMVKDNGGGIAEETMDRIFEPYFTTKEQGKGTGIGLYMSKVIVENNMNGRLTVENSEDGALFKVLIPGA
ncbi:MAG: DUF3365 domain-containing protein [Nitrospirae bacterium YQR-1]